MVTPLDILFEYWIEHVTFGHVYAMFGFSIWIFYREFQALQLIVSAVIGDVDEPLASCMSVHVLEIYFEMIVGL